jgi:hypothetical protein
MNNSMIAKLLAKENITVQSGNYRTAFFDVEKRVLGLPKWKDMGKDVYDLMVGHEVGHALYTPAVGWHESTTDIPGIPRSYVNIVEDIRIEKLIQRTYPGLTSCFKRGYKILDEQDFFGLETNNIDPNQAPLMDRINLKAKLRDLITIDFSDKEASVVKQAFDVETWDDVIEACRALYEFIGENNNEQDSPEDEASPGEDMSDEFNEDDITDEQEPEDDGSMEPGDSDDQSDAETSGDESPIEVKVEDDLDDSQSAGTTAEIDPHSTLTDDFYRDNTKTLIDVDKSGYQKQIVKAITRDQLGDMLMTYPELAELRKGYEVLYQDQFNESFKTFSEETKKFVSVMAKEFEMRKAAYRTLRAQTSRSGSLDLNKLHMYKTSDDIFSRVTQLADAKSHGMVMFIDYSGSMCNIVGDVIRQTLILSEFCKKVGIPFDVYTFTSLMDHDSVSRGDDGLQLGEFDHSDVSIKHVLSSSMPKSTYMEAVHSLYRICPRSGEYFGRSYDSMGGTPLCETVMAARFILKDFKAKHNIQKVNVVFLTDGDAQSMYYKRSPEGDNMVPTRGYTIDLDGKFIDQGGWYTNDTCRKLLDTLRKEYNVIGYFLAERPYDFKSRANQASKRYLTTDEYNVLRKEYNKNKFISMDDTLGYDKFFIIKAEGRSLETSDDEFVVADGATKGAIAKAFKKHANSKKTNKLFATQFAKMVA